MSEPNFRDWIRELEDLTPAQAFKRVLDAFAEAQNAEEIARLANWERIKAGGAAPIAKQEPVPSPAPDPEREALIAEARAWKGNMPVINLLNRLVAALEGRQ